MSATAPDSAPSLSAVQAAITLEKLVWRAGAMLFVDTDDRIQILYPQKLPAQLIRLCRENYNAIDWLLRARAS